MNAQSVTLEDVLAAAAIRGASLVPETSGYLALAVGDATARLPFRVDDRAVALTTEGTVTVARGSDVVPPTDSARLLRDLLGRLLAVSAGSMPGLAQTARSRDGEPAGVDGVIRELEAALIPVNRAAARRALARLARETLRAKESGKLRRRARLAAERAANGGAPRERGVAAAVKPARDAAHDVWSQLSEPAPSVPAPAVAPPVVEPVPQTFGRAPMASEPSTDDIDVAWETPVQAAAASSAVEPTPPPGAFAIDDRLADPEPVGVLPRETDPSASDDAPFEAAVLAVPAVEERTPTPTEIGSAWVEQGAPSDPDELAEATSVDAPVAPSEPEPVRPPVVVAPRVEPAPARPAAAPAPPPREASERSRDESTAGPGAVERREVVVVEAPRTEAIVRAAVVAAVAANEARAPRVVVKSRVVGETPVPPRPRWGGVREAELAGSDRSNVEDLLASFGGNSLDGDRAVRAVAAGLKTLAGLEPTPPPPGAMLHADDPPTPLPAPVRASSPPFAAPQSPPRRAASLAVPLVLFLVAATSLGWLFRSEIRRVLALTGSGSQPTAAAVGEPAHETEP